MKWGQIRKEFTKVFSKCCCKKKEFIIVYCFLLVILPESSCISPRLLDTKDTLLLPLLCRSFHYSMFSRTASLSLLVVVVMEAFLFVGKCFQIC